MAFHSRLPVDVMGRKVRVYRNLHTGGYSVQLREPGHRFHGRVVVHSDAIMLRDVRFVVSEAGRQRVLREKRKNVHAFAEGYWTGRAWYSAEDLGLIPLAYNPYLSGNFRRRHRGEIVHSAEVLLLDSRGMAGRGLR